MQPTDHTFFSVRYNVKTNILTSYWKTPDGRLRKIEETIQSKEPATIPHKDWVGHALKEVEVQKEIELAQKLGRSLPGINDGGTNPFNVPNQPKVISRKPLKNPKRK